MSETDKLKINKQQLILDQMHLLSNIITVSKQKQNKKKNSFAELICNIFEIEHIIAYGSLPFTIHLSRYFLLNITTQ